MDREQIERQDFPTARRGYDPEAVREHLRRVADELEALAAQPRAASLAEGASAQVGAILEAAETSARQLRDDAQREASDHVERVSGAAAALLEQLQRAQQEVERLMGDLRVAAAPLTGSPPEPAPQPAPEPEPPTNGARSDDEAGARLVALNMALEGRSREETAGYLAEHFDLADVEALLDDVYTSAGR